MELEGRQIIVTSYNYTVCVTTLNKLSKVTCTEVSIKENNGHCESMSENCADKKLGGVLELGSGAISSVLIHND